jgi:alpha-tubulin suppressor-like RCC1 family protein
MIPATTRRQRLAVAAMLGAIAVTCSGVVVANVDASRNTTSVVFGNQFSINTDGSVRLAAAGLRDDRGDGAYTPKDGLVSERFTAVNYENDALADAEVVQRIHNTSINLVLTKKGEVFAWGQNDSGLAGDGTAQIVHDPALVDLIGTAAEASPIVQLGLGAHTVYALTADGSIVAWGGNRFGQLGNGSSDGRLHTPTDVSTAGFDVDSMHALADALLIQTPDGTLKMVGESHVHDGGYAEPVIPAQPTTQWTDLAWDALDGEKIVDSAWALEHGETDLARRGTLLVTESGSVWVWGNDTQGSLAQGSISGSHQEPKRIRVTGNATPHFVEIDGENNGIIARDADGGVWTWGRAAAGKLGNGTRAPQSPIAVRPLDIPSEVVDIDAGYDHNIALVADGSVWGWGQNENDEFGLDDRDDDPVKLRAVELSPSSTGVAVGVYAGYSWSAVTIDSREGATPPALPRTASESETEENGSDAATEDTDSAEHGDEPSADKPLSIDEIGDVVDGKIGTISGTGNPGAAVDVCVTGESPNDEDATTDTECSGPDAHAHDERRSKIAVQPEDTTDHGMYLGSTTVDSSGKWSIDVDMHIPEALNRLVVIAGRQRAECSLVHVSADNVASGDRRRPAEPTAKHVH